MKCQMITEVRTWRVWISLPHPVTCWDQCVVQIPSSHFANVAKTKVKTSKKNNNSSCIPVCFWIRVCLYVCTSSLRASSCDVKVRGQKCAAAVRPRSSWNTHTQVLMALESAIHLNKRWLTQGAHCEPPHDEVNPHHTVPASPSALVSAPLRAKFTSWTTQALR